MVVAGGVSANIRLREKLKTLHESHKAEVFYPRLEYCSDNGAMVAYAGFVRFQAGFYDKNWAVIARARWPLDTINEI